MKRIFLAPRQSGKTYAGISDFVDRTMNGKIYVIVTVNSQMADHIRYQIKSRYPAFGYVYLYKHVVIPHGLINRLHSYSVDKIIFDECIIEPHSMIHQEIIARNIDVDMFITPYSPKICDGIANLLSVDTNIEVINCNERKRVSDYIRMHNVPPIIINPLPDELFVIE